MTKRLLLAAALCIAGASTLPAQNIRNHYVSKAETDGVIYHTFPVTLFENREAGDLTFDITYKEHRGGRATINFTCRMAQAVPADSVRFAADAAVMSGPVDNSTSNRKRSSGSTGTPSMPTGRNSAASSTSGLCPR